MTTPEIRYRVGRPWASTQLTLTREEWRRGPKIAMVTDGRYGRSQRSHKEMDVAPNTPEAALEAYRDQTRTNVERAQRTLRAAEAAHHQALTARIEGEEIIANALDEKTAEIAG